MLNPSSLPVLKVLKPLNSSVVFFTYDCLTCFALILLFHISLCCAKEYYSRLCKYFTEFESHLPNLPTHLPTHQSFFLPQMLIILEVMYCLGLKDTVVNKAFTVSALLSLQSGGGNKQPINKCISKKKNILNRNMCYERSKWRNVMNYNRWVE